MANPQQLIDPKLTAAGWKIVPFVPGAPLSSYERCAVVEFETANGPADYALCVGAQVLGIVEAKKLTLGPQSVLTQAERYSKGATANPLTFGEYRVPFLYSTNGEIVWHADIRNSLNRSHPVAQFHTPAALAERLIRTPMRPTSVLRRRRTTTRGSARTNEKRTQRSSEPSPIENNRCSLRWRLERQDLHDG